MVVAVLISVCVILFSQNILCLSLFQKFEDAMDNIALWVQMNEWMDEWIEL